MNNGVVYNVAPKWLSDFIILSSSTVVSFLQSYGYLTIGIIIIIWFIYSNVVKPYFEKIKLGRIKKYQDQEQLSPEQLADLAAARRKQQQLLEIKALEAAEKQKEKDKEKLETKLTDWEKKHWLGTNQPKKDYRGPSTSTSGPLSGFTGGKGYRPSGRNIKKSRG